MNKRKLFATAAASALAASMVVAGGGAAYADTVGNFGEPTPSAAASATNLLKTYGVRAGSAGPDFLGITNTNYDFVAGGGDSLTTQYGYSSTDVLGEHGLGIWGTEVNESPNPYYSNLIYQALNSTYTACDAATSWMKNSNSTANSSWGDSFGAASSTPSGTATIAGLEYSPEIVFGANKYTNWSNFDASNTNIGTWDASHSEYNAEAYVNNDATNIWTQIYTLGQLATTADGITTKSTRYGSATTCAVNYERAIRGQMLYVAKKIQESAVSKKTVAYLYAIDGDVASDGSASGTAYFFTPTASGLVSGTNDSDNYAANNSTVNMGYMGTLPFVTDTYDSGNAYTAMTMTVEDITKTEPVCTLDANTASALADVDVIIYNTNKGLNAAGTSGGKNNEGIVNSGCFANQSLLDAAKESNGYELQKWLAKCGFTGTLVAGDDWGTSKNQDTDTCDAGDATVVNASNESVTIHHNAGQCPVLYCMRNYTADKNARAAWAWSQVYPELYGNDTNATYEYWVKNVYHVKDSYIGAVVKEMTRQTSAVTVGINNNALVHNDAEAGYSWWSNIGSSGALYHLAKCVDLDDVDTLHASVYRGTSRASYYDNNEESKVSGSNIGIYKPSSLWTDHSTMSVATTTSVTMASVDAESCDSVLEIGDAYAEEVSPTIIDARGAPDGNKGEWSTFNGVEWTLVRDSSTVTDLTFDNVSTLHGKTAYEGDVYPVTLRIRPAEEPATGYESGEILKANADNTLINGSGTNLKIMYPWDDAGVFAIYDEATYDSTNWVWTPTGNYDNRIVTSVVIEEGVTEVPYYAFRACYKNGSSTVWSYETCAMEPARIDIASTVASIDMYAFFPDNSCSTTKVTTWKKFHDSNGKDVYTEINFGGVTAEGYTDSALNYIGAGAFNVDFEKAYIPDSTVLTYNLGTTHNANYFSFPQTNYTSSVEVDGETVAINQLIRVAKIDNSATKDELAKANETIADLQGQLATAQAEQAELKESSEATKGELTEANQIIADLQQKLSDAQAELAKSVKANSVTQYISVGVPSKAYKAAKKGKYKGKLAKARTFKIGAAAVGKLTYKVTKGAKYVTVSKTGKVTVKKGAKKGTYKIRVSAAANGTFKAAVKYITVRVK